VPFKTLYEYKRIIINNIGDVRRETNEMHESNRVGNAALRLHVRNSLKHSPGEGFLRRGLLGLAERLRGDERIGSGGVTRGEVLLLLQATDGGAGEEVRRERELVDPRQDDVLGGLGDEDPEHRHDAGHPQLDRGHRRLEEQRLEVNMYTFTFSQKRRRAVLKGNFRMI